MKSKDLKGYIGFLRLAFFCLTVCLIFSSSTLIVAAASETQKSEIIAENYNISEQYSLKLSEEINYYSEHDATPQKTVSKNVLNVINIYRKELLDLQSHPDVSSRPLTKEAETIYTKGYVAGKVSWIYYYNLPSLKSAEAIDVAKKTYENFMAQINESMGSGAIDPSGDPFCAELNTVMYTRMTKELEIEGELISAKSVISSGCDQLAILNSPDLFGKEHLAVYEATVKELHLQRAKDFLSSALEDIFNIMYPESDFSNHAAVSRFTYQMRNALTVQEANTALRTALDGLLSTPESKKYSFLFTSTLKESIAQTIATCSKENSPADVLPLFSTYQIEAARAAAKDEISDTLYSGASVGDAETKRLEALFNSSGGILDSAESIAQIKSEIVRAQYVKRCYSELCGTNEEIEIVLQPYDPPRFLERTRAAYMTAVESIFKLNTVSSLESSCQSTLAGLSAMLKDILTESKAERFLLDHKEIISKSSNFLTVEDELALRHALTDYAKLEENVRSVLTSQINSIAKKYNTVLSQVIRAKMSDDALYLDICEIFCTELKELSRTNIDVFYNNCEFVFQKADALHKLISEYRALAGTELYQSYTASERESLVLICREAADEFYALDVEDKALFEEDLTSLLSDAKVDLSRTHETVRIRVAARASENTQIKSLIAEANAKIKASYDKAEMASIADKAIFKINRLLASDAIDMEAEKLKYTIKSMKFLTADEKSIFKSHLSTLQSDSKNDAMLSENITVLEFIWNSFSETASKIFGDAEGADLVRSRDAHLQMLKKECDSFISDVRAMVYLTAAQSDDFLNKSVNLQAVFKTDIVSAQKSAQIEELYSKVLDTLHSLALSASNANLSNYKSELISRIGSYKNAKEKYSVENYNKISEIISALENDLSVAGSISACDELLKNAIARIELVNDLLDDAKQNAIKELEEKVALYKKSAALYSSSAMTSIDKAFSDAKREIGSYSTLSDIDAVNAALKKYLDQLSFIKRDYVSSSDDGLGFLAQDAIYPLQYDFAKGYWGLIYLPDRLPPDVSLSILPSQSVNNSDVEKLIKDAINDQTVKFYGTAPTSSELRLIRNSSVKLGVDISLSDGFSPSDPFTLQMLLPSDLNDENILGVVFVTEDGGVEFYSVEQRDLLISLTLNHLSQYYIVVEKTTDLEWLIILLTVLIFIELAVFAVIVILRHRRKRKENNMFPLISSCFVSPASVSALTRIRPEGAVSTTILLSVAALAIGCAIALFTRAELNERKQSTRKPAYNTPGKEGKKTSDKSAAKPRLSGIHKPLLRAKRFEIEAPKENSESISDDEIYYTSEADTNSQSESRDVLCAVAVESTGAAEASQESLSYDDIEQIYADDEPEPYTCFGKACHKTEINLDVIAQKFSDGDLVTLDALKRKHLVPKKTDYVKILARGALSKPLIIEAHDFSRAAEEMLIAVGGEAIRIRKS